MFTALFSNESVLRELYCALSAASIPQDTLIKINTLENVLYMDFINDLSFEIGGKLVVLIEHQSTINPNMALRLLLYITRVFEKKLKSNTLYSKKQLKIPFPEFFVLYNGVDPFPDSAILRLSDMFENLQDLDLPEKAYPLLELEVKIININEGRNKEIVNRCKILGEYSLFVDKVRFFLKQLENLEEAMKKTIQYCKKHDILREYLEVHGSEVLNMLLEEWNMEDAEKVWREEAKEEGREEARYQERKHFFDLLDRGLSPEEIKQRLSLDGNCTTR
jgi:predicted transposase/invertase (TIGR01784 family)